MRRVCKSIDLSLIRILGNILHGEAELTCEGDMTQQYQLRLWKSADSTTTALAYASAQPCQHNLATSLHKQPTR